jgi:hypothetical protein
MRRLLGLGLAGPPDGVAGAATSASGSGPVHPRDAAP